MVRSTRSEAESLPLTGSHGRLCLIPLAEKLVVCRSSAALSSLRVEGGRWQVGFRSSFFARKPDRWLGGSC